MSLKHKVKIINAATRKRDRRERIATAAMQGMIVGRNVYTSESILEKTIARSLELADALIAAVDKDLALEVATASKNLDIADGNLQ